MRKILKSKACCISSAALIALAVVFTACGASPTGSLMDEWDKIKAPQKPELKDCSVKSGQHSFAASGLQQADMQRGTQTSLYCIYSGSKKIPR